ncbi:tetraspanin-16 [Octodon degus]|uniref:Tetraspanin n=1 Tax=Octodon degus TaxID=10160 RepID=A0A6P6EKU6_OCTDE|nr:tetraspanin-16 [Octodon degus]
MAEPRTPYASLRSLLALLNGLVAASGVILIGLGIGIKYGEAALTKVLGPASTHHLHIGHLYLGLGCVAVLLALLGWCGAKRASRGSLLLYLMAMVVILVVQITVASVVLAFFPLLKCCGVNNYTDFPGSSFSMASGYSYPRSCCKSLGTVACDGHNVTSSVIHQEGCFRKLLKITKAQSYVLSWVSLGTATMQLPGVLATLLLFIKLG